MHALVIGPRKAVTACRIRVEAFYPMSKTALARDGSKIDCDVAGETKINCPKCIARVPGLARTAGDVE